MLNAIKTILADKVYYCNEVAVKLIESGEDKNVKSIHVNKILTHREIEVLQMIAMEMTIDEIAQKLFVAKKTINTHRQNLNVKNTAGLVKGAKAIGLFCKKEQPEFI